MRCIFGDIDNQKEPVFTQIATSGLSCNVYTCVSFYCRKSTDFTQKSCIVFFVQLGPPPPLPPKTNPNQTNLPTNQTLITSIHSLLIRTEPKKGKQMLKRFIVVLLHGFGAISVTLPPPPPPEKKEEKEDLPHKTKQLSANQR